MGREERVSERRRKWVNQHNYSLMQTTPHCLYSNKLMRLQTGKKKQFHRCFCLVQATKENELSHDLNGDRVFTQAGINIWLPGLMSNSWKSRVNSLSCEFGEKRRRKSEKINIRNWLARRVMALVKGIHRCDWILLLKGNFNSEMPYQCDNRKINNVLKVFHYTLQNDIQRHN